MGRTLPSRASAYLVARKSFGVHRKHEDRIQMWIEQKLRFKNTGIAAHIWILAIAILMGYSNPGSAAITQIQYPQKCFLPCCEISGQITKSDLQYLARAADIMSRTKAIPNFRLNSNGGDIEIAIAIGHNFGNFMRQL
jgi:hypothetical protein